MNRALMTDIEKQYVDLEKRIDQLETHIKIMTRYVDEHTRQLKRLENYHKCPGCGLVGGEHDAQ